MGGGGGGWLHVRQHLTWLTYTRDQLIFKISAHFNLFVSSSDWYYWNSRYKNALPVKLFTQFDVLSKQNISIRKYSKHIPVKKKLKQIRIDIYPTGFINKQPSHSVFPSLFRFGSFASLPSILHTVQLKIPNNQVLILPTRCFQLFSLVGGVLLKVPMVSVAPVRAAEAWTLLRIEISTGCQWETVSILWHVSLNCFTIVSGGISDEWCAGLWLRTGISSALAHTS